MVAPHNTSRIFIGVLFACFAAYLLSLAIQYTDSDLWFHLSGGRYLLETGALYNPLVNSYLEASREFINYFWGFQVLTYSVWSIGGETGLIIFKTLFFLTSAWFVMKILMQGESPESARLLPLIVLTIVIAILCSRGLAIRPHLASYAMIPIFIYILGYRQKLYPLLPLLTVAWVNLHGVEWVVGALICGSYFLQHLIGYLKDKADFQPMIWMALCLPAMMLNPNGVYVLLTPFVQDPDLNLVILELGRFQPQARFDLFNGVDLNTMVVLLLVCIAGSVFAIRKDLIGNIAPLLIAAGGLVLLFMAVRFIWEWALLSLPLVAAGLRIGPGPRLNAPGLVVLGLLLFSLIAQYWPNMRHGIQHYPLDMESLPFATTAFIKKTGLSGRYAVEPSYAGYINFELADHVKTHMDMQFPPFTTMDIQAVNTAMRSAPGFATYAQKYEPDMVGVRKTQATFPVGTALQSGYVPVFFDNKVVLFVNRNKHPEVADRYQLKVVNPFNETVIPAAVLDQGIAELERMLSVVDADELKLTLVGLLVELGDTHKSGLYLSELQLTAPDDVSTVYYTARHQHLEGKCKDAVENYEFAIKHSAGNPQMHRQAAECYFLIGDQVTAFEHFSKGINPYKDNHPDPLTYFQFALSAVGAGEHDTARRLLTMIGRFAPDSELAPQISKMLEDLESP